MSRLRIISKLVGVITGLSVAVLAVTGFWALAQGEAMTGYMLMLHCTVAPVFCLFLGATAIMGAERNRFEKGDGRQGNRKIALRKTFFWLMILAGIPVILSMILSMLPWYGSTGQEFLYQVHQYSTLLFVLVAIVLGFLTVAYHREGREIR